ncbi:MAG: hypothetical protein QME55_02895 [Brevundimonas sp.]|uniref:DUF6789 family protein n=1 Tax=Brevundimonas sp. TaxID=1871086 RepID=UPI002601BAF5|nr:DUF6789 family protein [Brevundimonas sp.]MDI6623653.1 hypothetical protein [Brevundimonas sp.]MDQ7812504.1 hypothetical protein [Brevundimonas sp.]
MSRVQKGLVAGLAATVVVSIIEAINMTVGHWAVAFPQLLSVILQQGADQPAIGWVAHLVAGLGLGAIFGVLCPRLPTDTPESKGILFAVGAFVLMGLVIAPIGGAGMFFMRAGFGSLAWMIASHAIYGIVLGNVYGRLVAREKRHRVPVGGATAH